MKPRWRRKRALLVLNKKKGKKMEAKKKDINKIKTEIYKQKHLTNSKQILCHDKIKTRSGHLSATDYLGRAFPDQRYVK